MSLNTPLGNPFSDFGFFSKLGNYVQFMDQLESTLPGTRDGKVKKEELQQGYDTLLAEAGDQIPQEIKDRFRDGQAFADQFEQIDALGVKDDYVNAGELALLPPQAPEAPEVEPSPTETSDAATGQPPKPEDSPAEASDSSAEEPPEPEPASGDD